jgi:hypothetical protein
MNYTILSKNDNGTVRVKMELEEHVLEQDFYFSDSMEDEIKMAMAVFQREIETNVQEDTSVVDDLIGVVTEVTELPEIPSDTQDTPEVPETQPEE